MSERASFLEHARILEELGIIAPPTRASCCTLTDFIRRGNSVAGENPAQRIQQLKELQATWIGNRVRHKGTELGGVVMYLIVQSLDSVVATELLTRRRMSFEGAFHAMISWDRGKPSKLRLTRLQILEESRKE